MNAIVKTKSNFNNCNDVPLKVVEISGTRVTCLIPRYGFNSQKQPCGNFEVNADFQLKEVVEFSNHSF